MTRTSGASRRRRLGAGLAGAVMIAGAASASIGAGPSSAVVPGDNGLITFESNRGGDNDIYVMNSDGTIEVNLTKHPANDVYPVWSPDGTQILFASDRHQPGNLDVYVMNVDGSGATQLTNSPGEDRGASYSSDGELIVFHSARNRTPTSHAFDLFTMNADGSNQQLFFPNASAAYVCGDSTSGTIVFNSSGNPTGGNPSGDFEIFTISITGDLSTLEQLTDNTVLDSGPKWSPGCSAISWNSLDAGSSLDVWRMDANGDNKVNLTQAPGVFDAFSAWSPDGEEIVFTSNREVNFEIFKMSSADGSGVTKLTFTKKGQANLRGDWGTAPDRQIPPEDKDQCKNNGWTDFTTPTFADQGACIDYVNAL
ncbi:MAG: TolB family protein [Acidimicrobiales bacterium]